MAWQDTRTVSPPPSMTPKKGFGISGTAIVAGSLVTLAILVLFALFAVGLGFPTTKAAIGYAVSAVIGLIAAFTIGGFVTSRLVRMSFAGSPLLHGIAMWATVAVVIFYTLASQAASLASLLASGTAAGAFATAQITAVLEQLAKQQPRLETEVELKEGKAVTTLKMNRQQRGLASETEEAIREEARRMKDQRPITTPAMQRLESLTQKLSWLGFFGLIGAFVCTLIGSQMSRIGMRRIAA